MKAQLSKESVAKKNFLRLNSNAKYSLRVAVAAVLAAYLALVFHLNSPYWAVISTLTVMNPFVGATLRKSIHRIVGTIVGALLGLVIASLVVNSLLLYLSFCFLVMATAQYFVTTTRAPYMFILGGLTALIVFASLGISLDQPYFFAFWRTSEVALGIVAIWVAVLLVYPGQANRAFYIKTSKLLFELDAIFCHVYGLKQLESSSFKRVEQSAQKHLKDIKENFSLFKQGASANYAEVNAISVILNTVESMLKSLSQAVAHFQLQEVSHLREKHDLNFESVLQEISYLTKELATVLQDKLHTFPEQSHVFAYFLKLEESYSVLRQQDLSQVSAGKPGLLSMVISSLQQYANLLRSLKNACRALKQTDSSKKKIQKEKFIRWRFDKETIQHCIKAGVSITLAVAIWLITGWFNQIQGIISSIVVAQKKTTYDAIAVAWRRLLGCVLGGAVGLFFLYFIIFNIFVLLLLSFIVIWIFSYFTFSSGKYSYIGLQANIAYTITVIASGGPAHTISMPLERLSGIVLGVLAVLLTTYLLWPQHPKKIIHTLMPNIRRQLLAVLSVTLKQGVSVDHKSMIEQVAKDEERASDLLSSVRMGRGNKDLIYQTYRPQLDLCENALLTVDDIYEHVDFSVLKMVTQCLQVDIKLFLDLALCYLECEINKKHACEIDAISPGFNCLDDMYNKILYTVRHSPHRTKVNREQIANLFYFLSTVRSLCLMA